MRPNPSSFLLATAAILALSACSAVPVKKSEQFWQRKNMGEAIYAQGPKAQQMLNRDIARCVYELQELERLGDTKDAIPTNAYGMTLDPDEMALADNDTPERDQNLFAEQSNYMDFETCMADKGWERTNHVPFEVAARGRVNYDRAHVDRDYDPQKEGQKKSTVTSNEVGDYGGLND